MLKPRFLAIGALLLPLASGCVRAHATEVPKLPPLDVPAPPPRAIEPIEADNAAPPPPEEPPRAAVPARPRSTPPPRTEPARTDAQPTTKPEAPPTSESKQAEESAKPATPPTTLQTTPAAAESTVERAIRATLARAATDLNRVDYRVLSVDARTQYDTAKRFIQQSDEAIREKNLVFAKNLADKAATLAAQLAGK